MTGLQQYVTDNPTKTLTEIQAYELVVDTNQVGSGQARGLFVGEMGAGDYSTMPIWAVFSAAANDINNPLFSLASAIIITASDSGSYFGMDITKADGIANRAGIASLVTVGVMTQTTADKFIAKTLTVTKPFEFVTQSQVNIVKGAITSKTIDFIAGKDIIVTINSELPELVAATVWRVETGFNAENAGRNTHIKVAQKYRIDMSGKKSGSYEVRVPLLSADFTVELV